MTVLVWPAALPNTMARDNHRYTFGDGRLRSATDVGPGKVRRRFSATAKPLSGTMILSLDQRIQLETFWNDDTKGGTLPFIFPAIGIDGAALTMADGTELTTSDGTPITMSAHWLVQFLPTGNPPSLASLGGDWWQASLELQVMP